MGGGKAEGSKVDAGGKGQEAVVGAGKVAGGVVAGGIWRADLEARRTTVSRSPGPKSSPV